MAADVMERCSRFHRHHKWARSESRVVEGPGLPKVVGTRADLFGRPTATIVQVPVGRMVRDGRCVRCGYETTLYCGDVIDA